MPLSRICDLASRAPWVTPSRHALQRCFHAWLSAAAVLTLCLLTPCTGTPTLACAQENPTPDPDAPQAPTPPEYLEVDHLGLEWLPFHAGMRRAKLDMKPIFLVVEGPQEDFWEKLVEATEGKASHKRLQAAVCIFVSREQAQDKNDGANAGTEHLLTLRRLLGPLQKDGAAVGAVVFLDFQYTILKRWDDAPKRTLFRKVLSAMWSHNQELATREREARKLIAKASYALEIKKYRESVQFYLKALEVGPTGESRAKDDANALRKKLDNLIAEGEKEAEKLEEDDKLTESLDRYERLLRDFPLPDKEKAWRKEITELSRRLFHPGTGRGG